MDPLCPTCGSEGCAFCGDCHECERRHEEALTAKREAANEGCCFYERYDTDCDQRIARAHREFERHGSILIGGEADWPVACAFCKSPKGRQQRLDKINRKAW